MRKEMTYTRWVHTYYRMSLRINNGHVDMHQCLDDALVCFQADPTRHPIEAACNDRGKARDALRPAWVDEYMLTMSQLEGSTPASRSPREIEQEAQNLWCEHWGWDPKGLARVRFGMRSRAMAEVDGNAC